MKQLRDLDRSPQKQALTSILVVVVVVVMVMPALMTFNDILARVVMRLDSYKYIQNYVVPGVVRVVGGVLIPFGLQPQVAGDYLQVKGRTGPLLVEIAWNCIGWQSVLFFLCTGWIGLQGNSYSNWAKGKAWLIGLLGTGLVNVARMVMVVLVAIYLGQRPAMIAHDYLANLAILGWILGYWWFVYEFVLVRE